MKRVVPWLLTFIVCTPNVLSGVETVNALTRDKKEQTKISDVKFSKDAIHSQEKMDLSFKIEKPKESPLERTYSIPKDIEHSLIPTKSKYVIKQKKKEVGEIRFKKDKMMVQWKQDTAQQKIETDCTLEVKAHYYNDEEEINKVKIGKEVTKILPATEPLEDENLLIQDIHYQPLERKKENQVVLDLKWPVTTELKEGNQYVFKLPKWMEAKKREISFKDEDKKNWFEAKIEKERITLKILKGKVYDPTVYRLPIVFRVNANQNEKVVQWMKRAIPLQKKSVAMDEIDTAAVDTTKETKEEHKQSSAPDSEPSSTREKTRSVSLTSDSADDATSTTTTDIQDAIILSHQEVKEGATEQEEIKIRTVEELLQKSQRIRRAAQERSSGLNYSISANAAIVPNNKKFHFTVNLRERYAGEIKPGMEDVFTLTDLGSNVAYLEGEPQSFVLTSDEGDRVGTVTIEKHLVRVRYEHHRKTYRPMHVEFRVPVTAHNFTAEEHELYMTGGNTKLRIIALGLPADQVQAKPLEDLSNKNIVDSISVSPSTCNDGEDVNIMVRFSEKYANTIHDGDSFTVRLGDLGPDVASLTAYKPKKNPQPLVQNGIEMADLYIYDHEARVVFKNVNLLHNIWGNFTFPAKARNFTPNDAKIPITSGNHKTYLTINGVTNSGSDENPFYYKSGDMSLENPSHVQWWLNGNLNQEELLDNVYIRDQVQQGHIVDWSTMYIYFRGGPLNGRTFSMEEFNNSGYGYIQKVSNTEFNVTISPWIIDAWGRWMPQTGNFTVTYQTLITNPNQLTFDNHSQICYRTPNDSKNWEEANATVKNIFMDGEIHGEKDLLLEKVDENNRNNHLQGAHFELVNSKTNKVYRGVTNKEGKILFKDIANGTYVLRETKAPDGYRENHKPFEIFVSNKGIEFKSNYKEIISHTKNSFIITNKKKKSEAVGPLLPNTGGDGYKTWLILVACTLILGTMILYIYKKKGTHTQ
ncbi:SpaA isopeptide-forming pilin-related protein [Catellicoccus marimammalium]|uniref:Collagen adhesin protein n=1 Tax=Catellicoccus marimammalium M35/04/3 TaxID=1234409 RepID=K8ZMM2_9ENTE|nr:SpaA isopeptide-forming pilin-related protein [Catellicoccus marimammalium]EKU27793.1 collagen adhesin protein [Catellicoccus marimammalium M35/04/3]